MHEQCGYNWIGCRVDHDAIKAGARLATAEGVHCAGEGRLDNLRPIGQEYSSHNIALDQSIECEKHAMRRLGKVGFLITLPRADQDKVGGKCRPGCKSAVDADIAVHRQG